MLNVFLGVTKQWSNFTERQTGFAYQMINIYVDNENRFMFPERHVMEQRKCCGNGSHVLTVMKTSWDLFQANATCWKLRMQRLCLFWGFKIHQKNKGGALNWRCDFKLSIWKGLCSRRLINKVLSVGKKLTEQSKEDFNSLPISSEHDNSPEVLMAISELIPWTQTLGAFPTAPG